MKNKNIPDNLNKAIHKECIDPIPNILTKGNKYLIVPVKEVYEELNSTSGKQYIIGWIECPLEEASRYRVECDDKQVQRLSKLRFK